MTSTQTQLLRCSNCRVDYEPSLVAICPNCGGASWVATRIAEREAPYDFGLGSGPRQEVRLHAVAERTAWRALVVADQ